MEPKPQVLLYTKPNCGLCNEMKDQMTQAGVDSLYDLEEIDIEKDANLFAQYRYEIPVLFINGVEAFRHRLVAEEFRAYITSIRKAGR